MPGSGGHTAEMLQLMKGMDRVRYAPWHYAGGQRHNEPRKLAAAAGGGGGGGGGKGGRPRNQSPEGTVFRIPRSREGAGRLSTVLSTARDVWALALTARLRPHPVVANGPHLLPTCVAALPSACSASRTRASPSARAGAASRPSPSRASSSTRSPTAVVQWPELTAKYKRAGTWSPVLSGGGEERRKRRRRRKGIRPPMISGFAAGLGTHRDRRWLAVAVCVSV